jgi:hypothetical protein
MSIDGGVLALLRAGFPNVWDGIVDADETAKIVSVPLPFIVYNGKRTTPENVRAGGRAERGNFPSMLCVGETREQADALADKVEALLDGKGLGNRTVRFFERSDPARDLRYTRTGGGPLFNVGLRFAV